jgi:hypothetical protein
MNADAFISMIENLSRFPTTVDGAVISVEYAEWLSKQDGETAKRIVGDVDIETMVEFWRKEIKKQNGKPTDGEKDDDKKPSDD